MRLLILFLFCSLAGFSQTFQDSLVAISHLPDTARIDSLVTWSRANALKDNTSIGLIQAKAALKIAKEKNIKSRFPNTRYYVGINHQEGGDIDSAIQQYEKGLNEVVTKRELYWKQYFLDRLFTLYRQVGDYQKALDLGIQQLKIYEKKQDSTILTKLYSELGYTYDRLKQFEKAIDNQKIALKYLDKENTYYHNLILGRIGIAYDDLGIYDSAHYYNQERLKIQIESGEHYHIGQTKSNIGNTYLKQKNWATAQIYLEAAKDSSLVYGDFMDKSTAHLNLGRVFIELEEFNKAHYYLNQGIFYAKRANGLKFLSEGFYNKWQLFKKEKRFDSALTYLEKYKILEDSLYDLGKLKQIEDISTKYETEKKEQEIKIKNVSLAKQESELKAKQRTIIALVIFTFLILVIAVAFYKRYQAKKNAEIQMRIIEEQERGTKAVFAMQEEERKRISKDLHDGVGQQLAGLKINFQVIAEKLKTENPERFNELQMLKNIVSDSAIEIRNISHTMMPIALTKLGVIPAIEEMLNKSLVLTEIKYNFEHFGIKDRLPENIEISLYRVAQELINNIIKHSNAKKVSVQLFKNSGKVIMVVEDDGSGISSKDSEGHGLLNMKSRINTLNGELNLEPSPNSGTLATIRIPL